MVNWEVIIGIDIILANFIDFLQDIIIAIWIYVIEFCERQWFIIELLFGDERTFYLINILALLTHVAAGSEDTCSINTNTTSHWNLINILIFISEVSFQFISARRFVLYHLSLKSRLLKSDCLNFVLKR